jgi:hypothetical protein
MNDGLLTFKACLISRIDLAIGTDFSGLADQPAENPACRSAYTLSYTLMLFVLIVQEGGAR